MTSENQCIKSMATSHRVSVTPADSLLLMNSEVTPVVFKHYNVCSEWIPTSLRQKEIKHSLIVPECGNYCLTASKIKWNGQNN